MGQHLAEMLLDLKYHGRGDSFRKRRPFSESVEAVHAILFNSRYNKPRKITAYRKWLETEQPCVFGRVAAKQKRVFICLIEEQEVLQWSVVTKICATLFRTIVRFGSVTHLKA